MTKLVWIDLETTGLDPDTEHVLEVACIVTDAAFVELGRWSAIKLDPVVREMHTTNGLLALVEAHGRYARGVDEMLCEWLQATAVINLDGTATPPQLAGSTISFDRAFLRRHMPKSFGCLHYRNLDVSSFNEMARRQWPAVYEGRPRSDTKAHRAMIDVEESINVARYYARALIPTPGTTTVLDGARAA